MKVFPVDIIMGILLAVTFLTLILGTLIFRNRREIGPLLLILSGAVGIIGPILYIIVQTEIIKLAIWPALVPIIGWILGSILSSMFWRKRG